MKKIVLHRLFEIAAARVDNLKSPIKLKTSGGVRLKLEHLDSSGGISIMAERQTANQLARETFCLCRDGSGSKTVFVQVRGVTNQEIHPFTKTGTFQKLTDCLKRQMDTLAGWIQDPETTPDLEVEQSSESPAPALATA